jgi:hypothetical protein
MDRKNKIRNTTLKSFANKKAGRNTQGSLYSGKSAKSGLAEKKGSGSEISNFLKNQFSTSKNANVTYRAYEIIPRNSPYSHHFKTLLNAESFISKKEYQMALDIYQRMLNKIPVRSSREKLEQNIQDIESFLTDYDEPFSPRVQLDISYSGQPPGAASNAPGQAPGGGAGGGFPGGFGSAPLQIQMSPMPQMPPGSQPSLPSSGGGGGAPSGGGTGMMPPFTGGAPSAGIPFGYFQAQAMSDQDQKQQQSNAGQKPFGFFDKVKEPGEETKVPKRASDEIEPTNNAEKLLKELSDGIFQIEKAIFETSKMKVESEEEPELPAPKEKAEAHGEEQHGEKNAEKAPATHDEAHDEEHGEAHNEDHGEKHAEETGAAVEQGEGEPATGTTGAPSEEAEKEEELGEGILQSAGDIGSLDEGEEESESEEEAEEEKKPAIQEIRGVLELKEPEQEDTPFITITYDFSKIPHQYSLSKDHNILEYAYYKYKPMLVKAQRFIRKKQITKALNYYRVIRDQQIPDALRTMVDKNIQDISEYLEKYLMSRPG